MSKRLRRAAMILALVLTPVGSAAAAALCPMIYQPVCAAKGSTTRTFANGCLAQSAGYRVVGNGRCGKTALRAPVCREGIETCGGSAELRQAPPLPRHPGKPASP